MTQQSQEYEVFDEPDTIPQEMVDSGKTVFCRLCGKWFGRLNVTHLRSRHDVDSFETYQEILRIAQTQTPVSSAIPYSVLNNITEEMTVYSPETPDNELILSEYQSKINSVRDRIVGYAKFRKSRRLEALLNAVDRFEQSITSLDLGELTIGQRLTLLDYFNTQVNDISKSLGDTAGETPASGGFNVHQTLTFNGVSISADQIPSDSRERESLVKDAYRILQNNELMNGNTNGDGISDDHTERDD